MNHIEHLEKLNNRYFGMRHGEAETNTKGIIVGDRHVGISDYGLTEPGEHMVRESLKSLNPGSEYIIVSSDFLRARQTAEIAKEFLRSDTLMLDARLGERFFGKYEMGPDDHYEVIWQNDKKDPEKSFDEVEPANHLMERVTSVVFDLENRYLDKNILIVSHGDPLQFLQTAFSHTPITEHQKFPLLDLGQVVELKLSE